MKKADEVGSGGGAPRNKGSAWALPGALYNAVFLVYFWLGPIWAYCGPFSIYLMPIGTHRASALLGPIGQLGRLVPFHFQCLSHLLQWWIAVAS